MTFSWAAPKKTRGSWPCQMKRCAVPVTFFISAPIWCVCLLFSPSCLSFPQMMGWLASRCTSSTVPHRTSRSTSWPRGWAPSGSPWCCLWACPRRISTAVRPTTRTTCSRRWWRPSSAGGSAMGSRPPSEACTGACRPWRWTPRCSSTCWSDGISLYQPTGECVPKLRVRNPDSLPGQVVFGALVGEWGEGWECFFFLMICRWKEKMGFPVDPVIWKARLFSSSTTLTWQFIVFNCLKIALF